MSLSLTPQPEKKSQEQKATNMGTAIFNRSTKICEDWLRHNEPTYDEQTHVAISVEDSPDRRTKRWDDAEGIRDATAQEIEDYDTAAIEAEALAAFDGDQNKLLKALSLYIAPKLSPAVTPAQLKTGVLAIYETL